VKYRYIGRSFSFYTVNLFRISSSLHTQVGSFIDLLLSANHHEQTNTLHNKQFSLIIMLSTTTQCKQILPDIFKEHKVFICLSACIPSYEIDQSIDFNQNNLHIKLSNTNNVHKTDAGLWLTTVLPTFFLLYYPWYCYC
jgi:hypothetical protein